jgi:hypothetical protein
MPFENIGNSPAPESKHGVAAFVAEGHDRMRTIPNQR